MITEWFIGWFEGFLDFIFNTISSLIPDDIPDVSGTLSDASGWLQWLGWFNGYFPLFEALAGWVVILGAWPIYAAVKGIIWVLTKMHILGGSSS